MAKVGLDDEHVDIAIIGAGIGGAAAGIALRRAGFDVHIFEQAPRLGEVGGGIVFREPSRALLAQWGVLAQLQPLLAKVEMMEIRDRSGAVINVAPAAFEGGETHCVHRADIHGILTSNFPAERLHLGHRVTSIDNGPDHAIAIFENGRRVRARLIVGADGLRSVVRTVLDSSPMTFLKQVTNRTIAPASLLPKDVPNDRIRIWQDGMRRLVTLPVRNGAEISLNAALPLADQPEKMWSSTPLDELLSFYRDFDPLVVRLIEGGTVPITTHALHDKEPIATWADRHVVLLGDAAHPMSPMNGQGANQAMQDAGALAAALVGRHRDHLAAALDEYQSIRGPATAHIQMLSRQPPPALARQAQPAD